MGLSRGWLTIEKVGGKSKARSREIGREAENLLRIGTEGGLGKESGKRKGEVVRWRGEKWEKIISVSKSRRRSRRPGQRQQSELFP